MAEDTLVSCNNLVKIYKVADLEVVALQGLDLEVQAGEIMALVGASGSGKSTLLNVMGGLDVPSAGQVSVAGFDLLSLSERQRTLYKRDTVGFVWQQPGRNLLPYLTARENVEMPMLLTGMPAPQRRSRALELLAMLDLSDRADFRPDSLSGGQQQRVALAVALANNPPLLLADEPTGQLDSGAAQRIFDALRSIRDTFNTTVIVVTHDPQVAARVDRIIGIRDGRTSTEIRRSRSAHDDEVREDEWVILDRAGRLQLPQVYVESLALRGRVQVRLEEDHVSVWPAHAVQTADLPDGETRVRQWRPETQPARQERRGPVFSSGAPAIETRGLWRTFQNGAEEIHAVNDVSIKVPRGRLVVVKGRSGSGKTTLLNLIGGLDDPSQGTVLMNGKDLSELSTSEKVDLRRREIAFVFQTFGLLPFMTARENVEAPLRLLKLSRKEREERSSRALNMVGLRERAGHRIHELSGGEQQRVALARAIVKEPRIILADEPTGQLDTVTGSNIIAMLHQIIAELDLTAIVASHDPKVEEAADLIVELHDGQVVENRQNGTVPPPTRF